MHPAVQFLMKQSNLVLYLRTELTETNGGGHFVDKETRGPLIGSTPLDNGLEISFYDQSRPVAGDRCMVQLLVDLPIPLDDSILQGLPESEAQLGAFLEQHGSSVHCELTKTRHFVPQAEADSILEELRREFMSAGLDYLRHPDFPRRYVLKVYREWAEKEGSRLAHLKAVQAAESEQ
jgi:hypothetical protein